MLPRDSLSTAGPIAFGELERLTGEQTQNAICDLGCCHSSHIALKLTVTGRERLNLRTMILDRQRPPGTQGRRTSVVCGGNEIAIPCSH